MNESLYNKIMTRVSNIVKKSINESMNKKSTYGKIYTSFDELKILNHSGNSGDILQVNQFNEYRVTRGNLNINESIFDDDMFDDDLNIVDKFKEWKDIAVCFDSGLWVYLDWIGLHKKLRWAKRKTPLYRDNIQKSKNGYKDTQFILNNYDVEGTLWDEVKKCKYPVFIPSDQQFKTMFKYHKLLSFPTGYYWSSSQYADPYQDYDSAFCGSFGISYVGDVNKAFGCRSVALIHF